MGLMTEASDRDERATGPARCGTSGPSRASECKATPTADRSLRDLRVRYR